MKYTLKIFLLLILISPFYVHSQTLPGLSGLSLNISPDAPNPGENVNFEVVDYQIDLPTSDVTWFVNGTQKARGVGLTKFSTQMGTLGSANNIKVVIITRDGVNLTKEVLLRPATVDMLWQADSYTPTLYRGKALPTTKNKVTVFANPYIYQGGNRVDLSKLRYDWTLNFETMPADSGVGKSTFRTKIVDIVGETSISLKVSTLDGSVQARNRLVIQPNDPFVLVYKLDDLMGEETHPTANEISLDGDEVRLRAEGYYYPESHIINPGLSYRWTMNGNSISADPTNPKIITIRKGGATSGVAKIGVSIIDPFDSFIKASRSFLVNIGSSASSGGGTFQ